MIAIPFWKFKKSAYCGCYFCRRPIKIYLCFGGAQLEVDLAFAQAGFFNTIGDSDGVVRSLPLLAEYQAEVQKEAQALIGMPLRIGRLEGQ